MRVSLAIPTRNRNDYLSLLLDSAVGRFDEVVVRDNAAGASRAIAGRYPSVRWLHGPELPIFENWRTCLDATTGDYVAIPSDDDLYLPGIGEFLSWLRRDAGDADVVIAGHQTIDEHGRVLGQWCPPRQGSQPAPAGFLPFRYGVPARMPAVFFSNRFLRAIGSIDTSYTLTAADSQLVQRALLQGRVTWVPQVVAAYRVWPGALTHSTQLSTRWLAEIDRWSASLVPLIERVMGPTWRARDSRRYADELLASNLIAGMAGALRRGGQREALRTLRAVRFPRHARAATLLRLAVTTAAAVVRLAGAGATARSGPAAP